MEKNAILGVSSCSSFFISKTTFVVSSLLKEDLLEFNSPDRPRSLSRRVISCDRLRVVNRQKRDPKKRREEN